MPPEFCLDSSTWLLDQAQTRLAAAQALISFEELRKKNISTAATGSPAETQPIHNLLNPHSPRRSTAMNARRLVFLKMEPVVLQNVTGATAFVMGARFWGAFFSVWLWSCSKLVLQAMDFLECVRNGLPVNV